MKLALFNPRFFSTLAISSCFALVACSPYSAQQFSQPEVALPETYFFNEQEVLANSEGPTPDTVWWETFSDPLLNQLEQSALESNFDLKAAWYRLLQAEERLVQAGSAGLPQLEARGYGARFRAEGRFAITGEGPATGDSDEGGGGFSAPSAVYSNDFNLNLPLTWELDLWRRIASSRDAADARIKATAAEVEATRLRLSAAVAEQWLAAVQATRLLKLIDQQINTSRQLLELTELRYSVGKGNTLEVLQQRQQLAQARADRPGFELQLDQALNQLALLTGTDAAALRAKVSVSADKPVLGSLPSALDPRKIVLDRPDVYAALQQLQAAEYDVAVAVADRFPRITLGLTYDFRASEFSDLLEQSLETIAANLALPITDGGRRRAVVREREARVKELLASFTQTTLSALADVENALAAEKHREQLIVRLQDQRRNAQATLNESRARYINGLSDYLQVTIAIQSLQQVERRLVQEETQKALARVALFRSLGGTTTEEQEETETTDSQTTAETKQISNSKGTLS